MVEKINLENVYIWGTGKKTIEINKMNGYEMKFLDVVGYIDNDKNKWGKDLYGKKIFSPEILRSEGVKNIFIPNRFAEEIKKQIECEYKDCSINIVEENLIPRLQIIARYEDAENPEIREIVEYLKRHPLEVFNYDFTEKYVTENLDIEFDEQIGLYYTFYCGKKMFFSKELNSLEKVKQYYKSILLEQDEHSPHLYLTDYDKIPENAVVVDAGVAEGNFSLEIIDKVKKIYMFEPDEDWCEALSHTFAPYGNKVVIINKALSNYCNNNTTMIDKEIKETVNLIKMDIEGEEIYALHGALETIKKSDDLSFLICTYHQEFAYEMIKGFFDDLNIENEVSKGYMWYPDGGYRPPVLRHGIIRAKKV